MSVAYLSAVLPCRSETFVYRELRALRERGWAVLPVSLRAPVVEAVDGLEDVTRDVIVVYSTDTWVALLGEALARPRALLATARRAARDAIAPGEPTPARERLKLPVQALAGAGLAARLRRQGVSHIHCHFAHAPTTVGMYAARHLDVSFSFTGHANDLFQRRALLKRKLERAAFVACISRWHRELYAAVWGPARAKCAVIRCGVDVERWAPRAFEADPGVLRISTVCRLVEKKGVDTLIAAVARLARPVALTIAGDGPERGRLERLTRELGCQDRVRFLGALDNEAVRHLMQRETHVFALPCRTDSAGDRDGVPVVLIEAMACGLPVIAGDLPAIRELVEHGVDGLLVAPNDAVGLAAELEALTAERLASLGRAARLKVEAEFSLSTAVERLTSALSRTAHRDAPDLLAAQ